VTALALLATGGTIATRTGSGGDAVARANGAELLALLEQRLKQPGLQVSVEDVFTVGSYLMTLPLMHQLAVRAQHHLDNMNVDGVVSTHGTDTMEETAYFLDLVIENERPVVLTGAQRPADAADTDGPRNLADALTVASHPAARGLGTLIVFGGSVFAARGTRKSRTLATDSFAAPSGGPLGFVRGDTVHIETQPRSRPCLPLRDMRLDDVRVDVVSCYPGADAIALRAFAAEGARGIVLEATGAGNANPGICEAVRELTDHGVVVVTSTRVDSGPVTAIYSNGGGRDLLAAGAVGSGLLRASQARVLLAALLALYRDPRAVRTELARHVGT
jgi:L-asparaginase